LKLKGQVYTGYIRFAWNLSRSFGASGGTVPPFTPSPFRACSSSHQCGEAIKRIPPHSAAEVHGADDIFPEFGDGKNSKKFPLKIGELPCF